MYGYKDSDLVFVNEEFCLYFELGYKVRPLILEPQVCHARIGYSNVKSNCPPSKNKGQDLVPIGRGIMIHEVVIQALKE